MNIVVTGANGLLGKHLVEELSQEHRVYAIVKEKIENIFNKNVIMIELDLFSLDTKRLPKDIDAIYYLAQSNHFRDFPNSAEDMFKVNLQAPLLLADWAKKHAVKKFIYASTGAVYTNPQKPVSEFFDINANKKQGFYTDIKLSAEILLKNYAVFFETFVIIRPFFMYGEEQNHTMLIPRLIQSVQNKKEITLSGEEGIKINPIYISDASTSVMNILNLSGEFIINIAGNTTVSLKVLAKIIGKDLGIDPVFTYTDTIQHDLIADISMMKEKLHKPLVDIKEGISNVVKVYKS